MNSRIPAGQKLKNNSAVPFGKQNLLNGIFNLSRYGLFPAYDAHEKFYYEKLQEVRYQDVYHKALCYCLGINGDTRKNADRIYNFKTGSVKTKCLHEGWQTSGSLKVVRMAFNLYCNSTPSVWDYEDAEEQVNECRQYTVEDIFCCAYAPYFWQAIQIRYPEYVVYNQKLHAMLGGID